MEMLIIGMLSGLLGAIVLMFAVGFWINERKRNR